MVSINLEINKQTRKQVRDNAEMILKAQGKSLDDFIDEKCVELILFSPMQKKPQHNQYT